MSVAPAVPVKVEDGLAELLNEPLPVPAMLQAPVPTDGVLPFNVKVVNPQVADPVWSAPALAVVGFWLNVTTTVSFDAVQGLFDMVHIKE